MALLTQVERWHTPFLEHLPKSDRPDVGAGYAMAAAATVAAVGFGIVTGLLSGVGVAVLFFSVGDITNPFASVAIGMAAGLSWLSLSGLSLAVVIPGGFVGGAVVWRVVPESFRLGGLLGGLLSTLVGYAVSCALVFALGVFASVVADPSATSVAGSVISVGLFLGFLVLYTSWATLPVGILAGYGYERSMADPP